MPSPSDFSGRLRGVSGDWEIDCHFFKSNWAAAGVQCAIFSGYPDAGLLAITPGFTIAIAASRRQHTLSGTVATDRNVRRTKLP